MKKRDLNGNTKIMMRDALMKALTKPARLPSLTLEPLPASSSSRAAIRRCRAAWKRAFDTYIADGDTKFNRSTAFTEAAPVYCAAMPALDTLENIRDFIACAAHGVLIGAIPSQLCSQLLYAAQVALGLLQYEAKSIAEERKTRLTPSPPPETRPQSIPEIDVND